MKIDDPFLENVLKTIIKHNARPILVGGCVRDFFLDFENKDYDIEVFGLSSLEDLEQILKEFGDVNLVGKSFGILKLSTQKMEYDFSFPRLETKTKQGHKGFDILVDGNLDFKEASKRRDFTINAIGYDYKNKTYLDPFDGMTDLKNKVLKHIDDATFCEDALRVYRAVQFSARFDFELDKKTFTLCKKLVQTDEFKSVSKERIYEEYKKLFLKSSLPSQGLVLLNKLNIASVGKIDIEYIDQIVNEKISDDEKTVFIYFILFELFEKISDDKKIMKKIKQLKNFKTARIFTKELKNTNSFVKKLIIKNRILNDMPKPLFMGKDLIKLGYNPSEKFKTILDTLYKMQLNGEIC